ncbi:MAG: hypothetical protein LBF54_00775 [Holosporaceae bacterium]|jgi:dihydrofolate synthase/folylpolyglutamate synthase|nr:hypothetical protein [Holosporaceae bacterium]
MQNVISYVVSYLESRSAFNDVGVIRNALEKLELNIDPTKVIVVAGTNGKGSVCATLQALLMEYGKNVGFLSSPHLIKVNERIKYNGKNISNKDFCSVFKKVWGKTRDFDLSYFEYMTLMAADYFFAVKQVDFAILEVGLGGTHDAVNAVPHGLSVITKLGVDHGDILGNGPLEIAQNKFGIISKDNQVFHSKLYDENVAILLAKTVEEQQAKAREAYPYDCVVDKSGRYPSFYIKTRWGDFKMSLQGERAAENTALAITVFDHLIEGKADIRQFLPAIGKVIWPGRMEAIKYRDRDIFLSGDHNPQGIQSLLDILKFYDFDEVHFVVGICCDKNHSEMLAKLMQVKNAHLYLTETPEKTLSTGNYDERFCKTARFMSSKPMKALDMAVSHAKESAGENLVIVTGSLYLVGKIKAKIEAEKRRMEKSPRSSIHGLR